MKYYEIVPTYPETPRNTTRKIANLYIEFKCHFLTLQKKNPITFEQECTILQYRVRRIYPGKYLFNIFNIPENSVTLLAIVSICGF